MREILTLVRKRIVADVIAILFCGLVLRAEVTNVFRSAKGVGLALLHRGQHSEGSAIQRLVRCSAAVRRWEPIVFLPT